MTNNDFSQYTRETITAMALYELRLIGRKLGVKSPTSLSKTNLIEAICSRLDEIKANSSTYDIVPGEEEEKPVLRGRPPVITSFVFHDSNPEQPKEKEPEEEYIVTSNYQTEGLTILDGVATETKRWKPGEKEPEKKQDVKKPILKKDFSEKKEKKNDTVPMNKSTPQLMQNDNAPVEDEQAQQQPESSEEISEIKEGVLEIMPDGYGFLRAKNYENGENDAYISAQKIKKCGLRKGDWVKAEAKKTCENRPAGVINVISVNGKDPETAFRRKNFDYLTPIYPDSRYRLEIDGAHNDFAIRSIDLVAPIGKGQRAMIVSPPKAGKTTLLKKVANSISVNYPKAHLIVLLIDERPEEVTDMQRSIKGEVVYSTFDEMPEHHTKASELVLERAKRLVELGEDVVILMDSLTRLARAYNLTIAPTGRTLSGGIDPGALHSPKRFFGAARNIENGGSLTIIATALIDTGSRMDDVIYEEFKGTGNMEIHLDRRLTEKRIFPAIDLNRSGTRREELLLTQKELETVWGMRRMLNAGDGGDASEVMISELVKTKTNKEFMEQIDMKIKMMQKQGFWRG